MSKIIGLALSPKLIYSVAHSMVDKPKITFIYDWLVNYNIGGGEQVLDSLWDIWPDAPVHTLIHDPTGPCGELTHSRKVITSFMQKYPRVKRNHRYYLPLMPLAVEQFDLSDYKIIISCSHAVAHGIIPQPDQLHINYIFTPLRFAWHLYHQYLETSGFSSGLKSWVAKALIHYLRTWDVAASHRIDHFVAISNWVAKNVHRVYHRHAEVIYPPVDTSAFTPTKHKDNFYLTVSRLVPYKRIDLIIDAFGKLPDKKLIVIGDGPERDKLEAKAGDNVEFLGYQPFETLKDYMGSARAFLFAAIEDFGIAPIEAQAAGTPVIAYRKGGVLETVIEGKTGLFFNEQTVESLTDAIKKFENEKHNFDVDQMRLNVERFSKDRFKEEIQNYVESKWEQFRSYKV